MGKQKVGKALQSLSFIRSAINPETSLSFRSGAVDGIAIVAPVVERLQGDRENQRDVYVFQRRT